MESERDFASHWLGTLLAYGEDLDLSLTEDKAELLLRHLWLVLSEGRVVNLTAITDPATAIVRHVVDSMLIYSALSHHSGRFIDIGTGAGYPGIVYAILSEDEGVLLDSVVRKIDFCRYAVRKLGLTKVLCERDRVEEYAVTHEAEFDVVLSRAMDEPAIIMEYAQPLLATKGRLVTASGSISAELDDHATRTAHLLGFRSVSRETRTLPHNQGKRTIDIYEKKGESEIALPRRIGAAKKRPLYRTTL